MRLIQHAKASWLLSPAALPARIALLYALAFLAPIAACRLLAYLR
jgi:hypothetical protein